MVTVLKCPIVAVPSLYYLAVIVESVGKVCKPKTKYLKLIKVTVKF